MTQTKRTNRTLAYYVPDPSLPIVSTSRAENHDVAGVDGYVWRNVSFALLWPYVEFGPNTLTIQSGVQRRDAVYSSSSSSSSSSNSSSSSSLPSEYSGDCDPQSTDRMRMAMICAGRSKFKVMSMYSC
jgi:hypothetical protein